MAISQARWLASQRAELAWAQTQQVTSSNQLGDRVEEHLRDFHNYEALGPKGSDLGTVLELGAGPWTQSVFMIRRRDFRVKQLILLDPSALSYTRTMKSSIYRTGEVDIGKGGGVIRPTVINAGAEAIGGFMHGTIDTLVMINVLEHVLNAPVMLRAI